MQSDTDKSGLGRLTLVQSVGRHLSPQPFSLISPSSWQSPPEVKFCSRWWEVQSFRVKHTYVVLWMGFFLIFQMKIIVYSEEYVKQWAYFLHKSAQCFELTTLFPQIHQLLNWYKKKKKMAQFAGPAHLQTDGPSALLPFLSAQEMFVPRSSATCYQGSIVDSVKWRVWFFDFVFNSFVEIRVVNAL